VEHARKGVCGIKDGGDTARVVTQALEERGELVLQDARREFRRARVDGGRKRLAAPYACDDRIS